MNKLNKSIKYINLRIKNIKSLKLQSRNNARVLFVGLFIKLNLLKRMQNSFFQGPSADSRAPYLVDYKYVLGSFTQSFKGQDKYVHVLQSDSQFGIFLRSKSGLVCRVLARVSMNFRLIFVSKCKTLALGSNFHPLLSACFVSCFLFPIVSSKRECLRRDSNLCLY